MQISPSKDCAPKSQERKGSAPWSKGCELVRNLPEQSLPQNASLKAHGHAAILLTFLRETRQVSKVSCSLSALWLPQCWDSKLGLIWVSTLFLWDGIRQPFCSGSFLNALLVSTSAAPSQKAESKSSSWLCKCFRIPDFIPSRID